MGPMKLYRLLQTHVAAVNALVVALYREEITAGDAVEAATQHMEETLAAIKNDG